MLAADAGWNQVPDDWRLMLEHGEGIAVATGDGRLAATALTHDLGSVGWISMVLVGRDFRRRGIATDLIERCAALLHAKGLTPGLDATEAGRQVYEPLGFLPVYGLSRRVATAAKDAAASSGVRTAASTDLAMIAAYDREIFGLDRAHILRALFARAPALAHVAERGGKLRGFALGRDGRQAMQIGPILADDEETAIELTRSALSSVSGRVYVDSLDSQRRLNEFLTARGFAVQRSFTRMLIGRAAPFDDPRRVFAIAGPELA